MVSVVTLGETMALVRSTEIGSLSNSPPISLGIGGAESNVAIALTRLGVPATWIGRVGDDSLGDLVERELRAEGLTVLALRDAGAPTGLMVKERKSSNSTRVWYYRRGSAGSRLAPDDIDPALIRAATLLHVTGITLGVSEQARLAVHRAISIARDCGVLVSFDLNYRSSLWDEKTAGQEFAHVVPLADIVFGSDNELEMIAGIGAAPLGEFGELARRVTAMGPRQVAVKLGADGCVVLAGDELVTQPAISVTAVDTVGAGDAFVGGYLADFLLGRSVQQRVTTAVTAGASACTVPGDWEGMPSRSDLEAFSDRDPVCR
ncbi:MAG: sugar kinase [Burkholderiaceae bacterium]|nr:sugar kinase [Microbacteriaceae bacterium]